MGKSKTFDLKEVAEHKNADSAWVIIDGGVYDVTDWLEDHPGGSKIILKNSGKDVSDIWWEYHSEKIFNKTAQKFRIGDVKSDAKL